MSEEISKIARVYQFLTDYGEQWKDAADQCGYADGIITKAEFRSFMLGSNFEWENEDSDASKKDLINKFWATIDTKRSGRIAGSTKSNLDALDKNEVDKMQEKIEMYDMAIKYADSLSLPEGAIVNDYSAWRKKIKESILSRVETYIKNGGKLENLQEFLEAQGKEAVIITTADMIAQDLIKEKVGDIPGYIGYDRRNGDKALTDLIDNYVNSLKQNPNISGAEISDTITRLVNAYVSTLDGMPSASDVELLGQYGYKITEKSGLNDLQKAVLNNSLTEKLAKIKVGDDYDKYPELFDQAIEEFIKSLLENTKMSEFATVKNYGIPEFEASEAFKNLKTKLQVSKFFSSDTFKNKIKEVLGETISEKVGGKWSGELPALDDIITVALKNAAEGAFGNPIDENKLAEWAIKQIEEKIKNFFLPDGFKDLSLTQMADAYSGVEKSAQDTQNIETLRFGAESYCDALIARNNSAFKNAVIDLFGENYAEKIKTLSSTEISRLMAELIAKIDELGDASTFKIDDYDAVWGIFQYNTIVDTKVGLNEKVGAIGRSCTIDGRTIDSSRITYDSSNKNMLAVKDNGEVYVVGGDTPGEYNVQVNILIDGYKVGTKTITVKVAPDVMALEESDDIFEGKKIKDILSGSAKSAVRLSEFKTWDDAKTEAKTQVQYYVNTLVKLFGSSSSKYNADKLQKAAQATINYFTAAIDAIKDHGTDSDYEDYQNITFSYTDANGKTQTESTRYSQKTRKKEADAGRTPSGAENIDPNSCGIRMNESYNKTNTYEFYLNTAILIKKFQEFYNSIL